MAPMSLPPGFRFHPTDEELVAYYLHRKITGRPIELEIIPEIDLYKHEPWDLPDKSYLPGKDMEWYFFSPRDKKYPNGSRTNRATRAGYWKATGKDRPVHSQKQRSVGMKKTLVYYRGRAPHGIRTNWIMHEYRLLHSSCATATTSSLMDSYALCRVFKKTIQIPKPKEPEESTLGVGGFSEVVMFDGHGVDGSGISGREAEDENFNSKLLSDETCSSNFTTPTLVNGNDSNSIAGAPFVLDEANSAGANMTSCYLFTAAGLGFTATNLIQDDLRMPCYGNMQYQCPFPPLEIEDFPQFSMAETMPESHDSVNECLTYDKYMNGTVLEEIY